MSFFQEKYTSLDVSIEHFGNIYLSIEHYCEHFTVFEKEKKIMKSQNK